MRDVMTRDMVRRDVKLRDKTARDFTMSLPNDPMQGVLAVARERPYLARHPAQLRDVLRVVDFVEDGFLVRVEVHGDREDSFAGESHAGVSFSALDDLR
ncbi:MAG: hypothetical protein ACREMQ_22475 [Longimicrobiales bacterium]